MFDNRPEDSGVVHDEAVAREGNGAPVADPNADHVDGAHTNVAPPDDANLAPDAGAPVVGAFGEVTQTPAPQLEPGIARPGVPGQLQSVPLGNDAAPQGTPQGITPVKPPVKRPPGLDPEAEFETKSDLDFEREQREQSADPQAVHDEIPSSDFVQEREYSEHVTAEQAAAEDSSAYKGEHD